MTVSRQLTLNLQSKPYTYPTLKPEVLVHVTDEELKDWHWFRHAEQLCETHDLEEPDRFGLGFDAAILREKRGNYSPFTPSLQNDMSQPEFWRKMYLDTREALSKAQQEYKELLSRFQEERLYARHLFQELQERRERERKEQEELDFWCDQMEKELTELLHGPDIFPQGR